MIYLYCFLISWASCAAFLVAVIAAARWYLPRYGMQIMAAAMRPPTFSQTPPTIRTPDTTHKH